ncbi:unnamed protein product [Caenorhabditis bovis]|uniref:Uncharacterized protein n=1 Tax=Caenorhabditis bovis TaxID=2654633 RepID=A0A8S1EZM0_9PELO|nr:unnamed protein product [Caenorhabditis bovis]
MTTTTTRFASTTVDSLLADRQEIAQFDNKDPWILEEPSIVFISVVVFIVAVALIAKIVISNRKKRLDLIEGSARWRISASRQSASSSATVTAGTTGASYIPMGRGSTSRALNQQQQPLTNGLDHPGPDRLDWERQFFDDSEATTPSRLLFR